MTEYFMMTIVEVDSNISKTIKTGPVLSFLKQQTEVFFDHGSRLIDQIELQ